MGKKPVLVILGTRPEAIKLSAVIRRLEQSKKLVPIVVSTGQHGDLLDSTLSDLQLKTNFDLSLMKPNQTLGESAARILGALSPVFDSVSPVVTLIQGDTTTALMGAVGSFYNRIPVGHVEAGLRTENLMAPFPEEANRRLISVVTNFHFTPTNLATASLLKEGVANEAIQQTGNTGVDALLDTHESLIRNPSLVPENIKKYGSLPNLVLVTCHRRETFGDPLRNIFSAISELAIQNPQLNFVFPIHPNPNVRRMVEEGLKELDNVHLLQSLPYSQFVFLLAKARVIITDSGGVQEEAPSLGKRTIVLRELTERSEAVASGMAVTVGSDKQKIIKAVMDEISKLDNNESAGKLVFGDGSASSKIAAFLEQEFA